MSTPPAPNPETVDAHVDYVWGVLSAEDGIGQTVISRGVGLVAFGGVIIGLAVSVARDALTVDLDPTVVHYVAVVLYAVAVISIFVSVLLALLQVLLPKQYAGMAMSSIQSLAGAKAVALPKVEAQGAILLTLIGQLAIERERLSSRIKGLRNAYTALVVGLAALGLIGIMLALRDANILFQ